MGHGQFGGTALPDERLAELRQLLLLQEEQDRLGALEKRYTDPASLAEDISRVVAEAIHTRAQRDRAIQLVLEPVLEDVLRIAVNRNPKLLADALFPVIGEAVRKAVGRALRGLVESLNQIVERRFSLQSLQWRWEAWSTGKSFGEIVLLRSLTYSVEQVFLVHRETGLLLQHAARDEQVIRDTDMVSGMLTAIQDFVHDSFGHANDHLETMQVGDLSVWIQHGPLAMLAGVVSGTPPPELRGVFQTVLEEIHAAYRGELAGFQGDTGDLAGTAAFLQRCFPGQSKQAPRQSWLWLWIPAIILIAPIAGAVLWARSHRQWEDFEARLRREPGIVLTSVEEHRGRHEISGLRDPLATDPKSLMRSSGIDTEKVDLHLQPYLSLDPQFVEIRRKLAEKDTLERQIIRFPVNSAHIEAAQIRMIDTAESAIRQLLQSGQKFTIEIRGHADATGAGKKKSPVESAARRSRAGSDAHARHTRGPHERGGSWLLGAAAQPRRYGFEPPGGVSRFGTGGAALISKKICLVGAYGVGKTSLVQRFLSNSFSDKYQTTVGVRIEKKEMRVGNQDITLILWDLAGEDAVTQVRLSYLRGTAGYILVADGTREDTLTTALDLQRRVTETLGELPFLLIVNKNDLSESWKISKKELDRLSSQGWRVFSASAKSGEAVEEVFHILAAELLV